MHAVHFAIPGTVVSPAVRAPFEQALSKLPGAQLYWHARPGRSSVFVQLAREYRQRSGSVLQHLRSMAPGAATTSLVCFSAGYGLAREMLAEGGDPDALVHLDALHAGWEPDGTPADAGLEGHTRYAQMAKTDPSKLLWLGHSDVPVAPFPKGYASTTDTAAELVRLAGGEGGQFLVTAYDVAPPGKPKQEHGAALTDWGPGFVAEALVPHLGRLGTSSLPWRDPQLSLGERCVLWSLAQVALGSIETWGRNAGERIAAYFADATRLVDGVERDVGIDRGDWCIVGLTAAERATMLPGEAPVLQLRVAGWEIIEDAERDGSWVPAADIRAGRYVPRLGDVGIMVRPSGSDPARVRTRHGFRFASAVALDGSYTSVDGNSGKDGRRWATNERSIHDPDFLGVKPYPQGVDAAVPGAWAEAVRASAEVVLGRDGLDYALAELLP